MDVWVQASFLPGGETSPKRTEHNRRMQGRNSRFAPSREKIDHTHVTRDAAVAHSHSNGTKLASDFRTGLAEAFGRLSAEQRASIREMLYEERSRDAA